MEVVRWRRRRRAGDARVPGRAGGAGAAGRRSVPYSGEPRPLPLRWSVASSRPRRRRHALPALFPVPAAGGAVPWAWGVPATARRETVAKESAAQAVSRIVSSCADLGRVAVAVLDADAVISGGVAVAVVDADAVISGGVALAAAAGPPGYGAGGKVRDAAARRRLKLLPTPVEIVEPAHEFLKKDGF